MAVIFGIIKLSIIYHHHHHHRNMLLPCSLLPVEPLLNQKTPPRRRENTVLRSTISASQPDEDELDGLTFVPFANDQESGADVTDAVTPAQDGE